MKKPILITVLITFLFSALSVSSKTHDKFRPSKSDYKKAQKRLKKMSVDEKIGQLLHISAKAKYMSQDSVTFKELKRQVTKYKIGGLIYYASSVYETVHLLNRLQENSEIPLLISSDFETGAGMRLSNTTNLPWNMAVSATGNTDFARRMGEIVAKETRALGTHHVYAPVVDVNNNAKNPVINVRSFGEDPNLVSRFGIAFSEGLQSGNVIATAKHFPGHGATDVDSHIDLPILNHSRERLDKTEFVPFKDIINSGVGSVMVSHIAVPKLDDEVVRPMSSSNNSAEKAADDDKRTTTIPATLSKKVVTNILKEDMNFDGLVVTDAMNMKGLTLYFDHDEATIRAILAGNDILLRSSDAKTIIPAIKKAVKSGRISQERLNESVRKILAWKYKLGLFKKKLTSIENIDKVVSTQKTNMLSAEIAINAITLVKYKQQFLPLKKSQKVLVLCVTNGNDISSIGKRFTYALRAKVDKVKRIALDVRSSEKDFKNAVEEAKKSDVVITALFGRIRSGNINSIGIPKSNEDVLRKVMKLDKPSVSVAFGNPYLILGMPEIKNYVVSYGAMKSLQTATAMALTGEIDFNGTLPITIGKYDYGTSIHIKNNLTSSP